MKNRLNIVLLIVILILSGCRHVYTDNPTILQAEKILSISPDSAFHLLSSINHPEKLSKCDYAAWCLHYTHAQYKLYMDIKSDSLIKLSADYYENSNLNMYSGTAYYLLGCICELNLKKKQAISEYKKANDLLQNTNNADLKGLVMYRIGYLLLMEEFYIEAESYINKSIIFFRQSKNTKYIYYVYRTKAELLYLQNNKITEILNTTNICEKLSLIEKDTVFFYNIQKFKGKILLEENPLKSKQYLLSAYFGLPSERKSTASLLAYAYSKLNMPDSARFYTRFYNVDSTNNNSLFLYNVAAAYVAKCEKKTDSAFIYFEQAYNLREKMYKQNTKEQLVRIDKQYDLSKKEAEKAKLEISLQKNIIFSAFLSIIVLAVLIILLIIINLNKKRKAAFVIEKQKLEFEVKTKKVENDKKMNILLVNLQNKVDNTLHFKRLQSSLAKTERKEDFIADITRQSTLTDKEWKYYLLYKFDCFLFFLDLYLLDFDPQTPYWGL